VVKRRYPFIEEIDGRLYADNAQRAHEAAILILRVWKRIAAIGLVERFRRLSVRQAVIDHSTANE
jgi:hypothetical protein